ncbi:hypothetical protein BIFCAT_00747 [Bifidobacterium catenulatum DSM 16992 = JCM 1194 = LMG 11043]|uniref:Uncharacterized protein n=1 Tax=Bifidobacterium catenulatum DSM 16992 = JCM 1194 = LMG 11043 TaxID=566552 RepID=B6XTI9_9BIFI|nr:hypothetical protein BIFCAT_00747 [Bifidobacterium catenulatum DSM 16992 = JCM 1194 = LMG 11043]
MENRLLTVSLTVCGDIANACHSPTAKACRSLYGFVIHLKHV